MRSLGPVAARAGRCLQPGETLLLAVNVNPAPEGPSSAIEAIAQLLPPQFMWVVSPFVRPCVATLVVTDRRLVLLGGGTQLSGDPIYSIEELRFQYSEPTDRSTTVHLVHHPTRHPIAIKFGRKRAREARLFATIIAERGGAVAG